MEKEANTYKALDPNGVLTSFVKVIEFSKDAMRMEQSTNESFQDITYLAMELAKNGTLLDFVLRL